MIKRNFRLLILVGESHVLNDSDYIDTTGVGISR